MALICFQQRRARPFTSICFGSGISGSRSRVGSAAWFSWLVLLGRVRRVRQAIQDQAEFPYVAVDSDDFKLLLMRAALQDGTYQSWIRPRELDDYERAGERFFPMELAALVHEESSYLAAIARDEATSVGHNVIVDAVLGNEAKAVALARGFAAAGYDLEVVDVEVPEQVSRERIVSRWREAQERARSDPSQVGGRWVPSEFVRGIFDVAPPANSRPDVVARAVADQVPEVIRYRRYFTSAEALAQSADVGPRLTSDLSRARPGAPWRPTTRPSMP